MSTEQRRAMCAELAEIDKLVDEFKTMIRDRYYCNTDPSWGHVGDLRHYKQRLKELLQ